MTREGQDHGWYLVLMIWGDRYADEACNRLIRAVLRHATRCLGIVVLSDRTDRQIHTAARQIAIAEDFNGAAFKTRGLPVKISMFDLPDLPAGAACVYLDLDSVVIGNLDGIARLAARAPLWTIPVFPRSFSVLSRLVWHATGRRRYAIGNSSVFVFRNSCPGNPTQRFRDLRDRGQLTPKMHNDDRFIAWSCQDIIRGFSTREVVNFRFEFLDLALWIGSLFAVLRRRGRQRIVVVTFAGPLTKPELLAAAVDGHVITDHHRRVGRWSSFHTSGLKDKIVAALSSDR